MYERGFLLRNGKMAYVGNIDTAVEKYLGGSSRERATSWKTGSPFERKDQLAQLSEIAITNQSGEAKSTYFYGDDIFVAN